MSPSVYPRTSRIQWGLPRHYWTQVVLLLPNRLHGESRLHWDPCLCVAAESSRKRFTMTVEIGSLSGEENTIGHFRSMVRNGCTDFHPP
jgi:hypothetical protein